MNHTIATLALTLLLGSGIPSQARSDRRNDDQQRSKHSFHIVDTVFHLDEDLSKVQIFPIFTYHYL